MAKQATSRKRTDARKLVAAILAGGVSLLLGAQYLRLLEPAAAREVRAACQGLRPSPTNPTFGELPARAADFTAQTQTQNGTEQVSLSDYRGQVVLVNFWASWCDVCASEKPSLEALKREFGDDLKVVTLASDSNWEDIRKALPDGAPYQVLLDPPTSDGDNLGRIASSYGISAVPESFLIDRDGIIRHYFINKRNWSSSVAQTCVGSLVQGG